MTNRIQTTILQTILEELRLLRQELDFLLPSEKLSDFNNSDRIKRSFKKALKNYPPVFK